MEVKVGDLIKCIMALHASQLLDQEWDRASSSLQSILHASMIPRGWVNGQNSGISGGKVIFHVCVSLSSICSQTVTWGDETLGYDCEISGSLACRLDFDRMLCTHLAVFLGMGTSWFQIPVIFN